MGLTEHETRGQLIDRQLEQAGWRLNDRTQIRREVPADHAVQEVPGPEEYGGAGPAGITDYCLYDDDGCVLYIMPWQPPLPLQQRFADLVCGYERLRSSQQESRRQAEHLFQSLLHRAFAE